MFTEVIGQGESTQVDSARVPKRELAGLRATIDVPSNNDGCFLELVIISIPEVVSLVREGFVAAGAAEDRLAFESVAVIRVGRQVASIILDRQTGAYGFYGGLC